MKKKIIYPLLAIALVVMSIVLLEGMTKKTNKAKHSLKTAGVTVVNNSGVTWTEIQIGLSTYSPTTISMATFPDASQQDVTVKVYFASSMGGAIQIVDSTTNTLGCSPSGIGSTRTMGGVYGSNYPVEIDIYSSIGCP